MEDVELVSDIRFFDLSNLSKEDKEYLKSVGVNIPDKPDFTARHVEALNKEIGFDGYASNNCITLPNFNKEGKLKRMGGYDDSSNTLIHELLHILKLEHPHIEKDFVNNPKTDDATLKESDDNIVNTTLSYNGNRHTGASFGALDLYVLQRKYGKSKIKMPNDELEPVYQNILNISTQINESIANYNLENRLKNNKNLAVEIFRADLYNKLENDTSKKETFDLLKSLDTQELIQLINLDNKHNILKPSHLEIRSEFKNFLTNSKFETPHEIMVTRSYLVKKGDTYVPENKEILDVKTLNVLQEISYFVEKSEKIITEENKTRENRPSFIPTFEQSLKELDDDLKSISLKLTKNELQMCVDVDNDGKSDYCLTRSLDEGAAWKFNSMPDKTPRK
jgi:hypothetical protein